MLSTNLGHSKEPTNTKTSGSPAHLEEICADKRYFTVQLRLAVFAVAKAASHHDRYGVERPLSTQAPS